MQRVGAHVLIRVVLIFEFRHLHFFFQLGAHVRQKGLGELVAFEVDVEQPSVRLESHASISQWRLYSSALGTKFNSSVTTPYLFPRDRAAKCTHAYVRTFDSPRRTQTQLCTCAAQLGLHQMRKFTEKHMHVVGKCSASSGNKYPSNVVVDTIFLT